MPSPIRLQLIILFVFALLITDCARLGVPEKWLPSPGQSRSSVYGAWVDIKFPTSTEQGELLAVTEDTLYYADDQFHAVPIKKIFAARLVRYDPHIDDIYGLTLLAVLTTWTHSGYLVFTMPLWIVTANLAANDRVNDPQLEYPENHIAWFTPYARFPQGLPPGLDRSQIRMKSPK